MEEFIKSLIGQLNKFNADMVDGNLIIRHHGEIYEFKYQLSHKEAYEPGDKVVETVDGHKIYAR